MCDSKPISEPEKSAKSYKPFSLQHWALAAVVKDAIKRATPSQPSRWPSDLADIMLFNDLEMWYERDPRVLNYELTFMTVSYNMSIWSSWLCAPLGILIAKWNQRFRIKDDHIMRVSPFHYCRDLANEIDTLKPSCSCRAPKSWQKTAAGAKMIHRHGCDGYMPSTCMKCSNRWHYPSRHYPNRTDDYYIPELYGHTMECNAIE